MTAENENRVATLVAENDYVKLVYLPGSSNFILVTFGDLVTQDSGLHFFAEEPARTNNYCCLGFVAKFGNWYPKEAMEPLLLEAKTFLSQYHTIITYGASMGGYGALKYSGCLKATHVISLCPQWSINKNECDNIDPGWQKYYNSELHRSMALTSDDVSGNVFVLYDPFWKIDTFHAEKILEVTNAERILVHHVAHNVTPALAGSDSLKKIIDSALRHDIPALKAHVRSKKKSYHRYLDKILEFSETRLPNHLNRKILNSIESSQQNLDRRLLIKGIKLLFIAGRAIEASALLNENKVKFANPNEMFAVYCFFISGTRYTICLSTYHKSILGFDIASNSIVHVAPLILRDSSWIIPVSIEICGDYAYLFVVLNNIRFFIDHNNGIPKLSPERNENFRALIEFSHGRFSIKINNKFLSASKHTPHVLANRELCSRWETFSLEFI